MQTYGSAMRQEHSGRWTACTERARLLWLLCGIWVWPLYVGIWNVQCCKGIPGEFLSSGDSEDRGPWKEQHCAHRGSERRAGEADFTQEPCSQPSAKCMAAPPEALKVDLRPSLVSLSRLHLPVHMRKRPGFASWLQNGVI